MKKSIQVLLVGDSGVGKSSLVSSLIKESYVAPPPNSTYPVVTIPSEVIPSSTVTTYIVDTSSRSEDLSNLQNELRKSDVVCVVYSVDNPSSFDRVGAYWLPMMRGVGVNLPVILVGNKIDLRSGEVTRQALEDEVLPLMNQFKEIETCVECSSLIPLNVSEVFFYAQKSVLNPTAPLWDSTHSSLKPRASSALARIFQLCDTNKDGMLGDAELNEFQTKVFGSPLQANELAGIQQLLLDVSPSYVVCSTSTPMEISSAASTSSGSETTLHPTGIKGITLEGFLYLHQMFIQRGRLETTWSVLRAFGYGEDLELRDEYLRPRFDVPADHVVELSPSGYQFLTDIFSAFDKDVDGALSPLEMESLFSTSPGNPWKEWRDGRDLTVTVSTDEKISLSGWLSLWSFTTLVDYTTTLAYLAYLGYSDTTDTTSALTVISKRRRGTEKKKLKRNVFLAYVLGAAGCGKTGILRSFVNKETPGIRTGRYEPTKGQGETVVNSVEVGGREKYLVLQEFGSHYESEVLRSIKKLKADVLVFVYDSSDTNSFSYISNLRQQYRLDDFPSLFVATKSDLDLAQQRHEVQPSQYTAALALQPPVSISVKTEQMADLYNVIINVASNPNANIPGGPNQSIKIGSYFWSTAIIGGLSAATFLIYRQFVGRTGVWHFSNWWGKS
ncbi:mitochondrial Rho GTPase [Atractiella rhizophila]|nr:mitochondrial Rho GTPase [Atractiella rhizophila]